MVSFCRELLQKRELVIFRDPDPNFSLKVKFLKRVLKKRRLNEVSNLYPIISYNLYLSFSICDSQQNFCFLSSSFRFFSIFVVSH